MAKINKCKCGCGSITSIAKVSRKDKGIQKGEHCRYIRGHNKSNNIVNLVGQVYGCWTVLSLVGKSSSNLHHCRWLCKCECGRTKVRTGSNLKKSKDVIGCHCGFTHRRKPFEALYNTISKQAKKRGVSVTLTYEDYLKFTRVTECHYCKGVIVWAPFNKMNGHHLDRKDNYLGYSKENCAVCCGTCNRVKSDVFTYEQFLVIGDLIRSWRA